MKKTWRLIYNTLFVPNRWTEYAGILTAAKQAGYTFLRLVELKVALDSGTELPKPFLVLRHDIDSDPGAALRFGQIEVKAGVRATYFFRLKTWNAEVIEHLVAAGHEVGYHFEELASYAKMNHIKTAEPLLKRSHAIREQLEQNLVRLRQNREIKSLASHGDFANRRLGLKNSVLAEDPVWRANNGILYEAYDNDLKVAYQNHISDKPYPQRFFPRSPTDCVRDRQNLLWLTHPRWWQNNPGANLREAAIRIREQIAW